jgi:hypothetical protein
MVEKAKEVVKETKVVDELNLRVARIKEVLEKLACGVINQVVLEKEGLVSVTDDTRSIFAYCKDEVLDFKADIGIYDLKLFLSFLTTALSYKSISSVEIRANRLYLTCDGDSYQYLLADSKLISTRVKEPMGTLTKINTKELIAEVDLTSKLTAITGALGLLTTTDVGYFKVGDGKVVLDIGTDIEHKISLFLASSVSLKAEWKISTVLLGRVLSSAVGAENVMLELRKDCPLIFKFAGLFVALSTASEKKDK